MPTVSIIVPVYKADGWLRQCLDSIPSRNEGVQLIVIDDPQGSGAWAARNRGIKLAHGEYIVFVDADDYLAPGAIWQMAQAMDGVDMVAGSFRKFGDFETTVQYPTTIFNMPQLASYVMGNLLNPRQNQMLSGCWAKMYRRSLVGEFPSLTTAEDMAFNFDYLTRSKSVRFLGDVVYHNRKREGSLSTTYEESDRHGLFGFLHGLKYVKRFLAQFYPELEIDEAVDNSKVYHSMLYFSRICAQEGGTMKDVLRKLYP